MSKQPTLLDDARMTMAEAVERPRIARQLILNGNARHLPLADGSVQCAVTSPPYWGLRSYSTAHQVWGGSSDCVHEWNESGKRHRGGPQGATGERVTRDTSAQDAVGDVATGSFCRLCNAWRGEYGSEPTPDLYVAHTVEIFREVRRVLRSDGVLLLNIGDCWNSSNGGGANGIGKAYGHSADKPGHDRACRAATAVRRHLAGGLKPKDLVGIPWMVAFALRADGWWLRDEIIWHKPNPMPSSVTDRTTTAHEKLFLLTKSARYFWDADAIREPITSTGGASFGKQNHDATGTGQQSRKLASPEDRNNPLGRNKRSVWTIPTQSFHGAHFATFPTRLVEPCIKAGTSERGCCPTCGAAWKRVVEKTYVKSPKHGPGSVIGRHEKTGANNWDGAGLPRLNAHVVTTHWLPACKCPAHEPVPCIVLDNFSGAATTGVCCKRLGRRYVGVELNLEYCRMGAERIAADVPKPAKRSRTAAAPAGSPDLFASYAGGAQ